MINLALVDGVPRTLNLAELDRLLRRPPDRRRDPPHAVPAASRRGARPHRPGSADRAAEPRRGRSSIIRGSADAEEARTKLMKQFKLSEIQANHILDMPLRRLTKLAREELENEHKELLARIKYLKRAPQGPEEDPRRHQGGARRDQGEVRRQAPHRAQGRRGRDERRGPHRRGGRRHHGEPRRLREAPARRELPPAGSRRQGHPRREPEGRGRGRRRLHDHDAPLAALLHEQGQGLSRQGPRGPRVRPHRARHVRREPRRRRDQRRREGAGRDRPQGVRGGPLPAVRDAQGHRQEDGAPRVRLAAHGPRRDQPASRATS